MHPNCQRGFPVLHTLLTRLCAPLLFAFVMMAPAAAALPTPQEYLSGFLLYVRWPDETSISVWQICVAAPASADDAQYANLVVRERKFSIRHVVLGDALATCHVLDLT